MSSWLEHVNPARRNIPTSDTAIAQLSLEAECSGALVLLDTQTIIAVEGPDAIRFLQGQCTADLTKLEMGESTLGAICNVKGRVIVTFRALRTEQGVLLRLATDIAASLVTTLAKYAAFFKVTMTHWPTPSVAILYADPHDLNAVQTQLPNNVLCSINDSSQAPHMELYVPEKSIEESISAVVAQFDETFEYWPEAKWYADQMMQGHSIVGQHESEQYLAHPLNLDKSGAISFTKGCYTGQEIIARTQYRGKTKKRVRPVILECEVATAQQGFDAGSLTLDADAKTTVNIISFASYELDTTLAALILPVDQSVKGVLYLGGKSLPYTIADLPYAIES